MYNTFKEEFPNLKKQSDDIWSSLSNIRDCAKIYRGMLNNDITEYVPVPKANRALKYINYLDQKVSYSFILNILWATIKGELSKKEASNSIIYIETYLERRNITNEHTNALNGFFPSLYRVVCKLPGNAPFSDKLAYLLNSKEGNLWMPDDEHIKEALPKKKIYPNRKACAIILAIANYVNNDSDDTLDRMNIEGGFSIDHILPQHPDESWYKDIPNIQEIMKEYLDTIGNLTLTTYNSDFGNRSFKYRLNAPTIGYKNSSLHINEYLKKQKTWGKSQILKRADIIATDFLKNRPLPSPNGYAPSANEIFEGTLAEDVTVFTGKTILGYTFDNEEFVKTKTKVECYLSIQRRLCGEYPDEFTSWAETESYNLHTEQNAENSYDELVKGIYVQGQTTDQHFRNLLKFIKKLDFDGSKISICYKSKPSGNKNTLGTSGNLN